MTMVELATIVISLIAIALAVYVIVTLRGINRSQQARDERDAAAVLGLDWPETNRAQPMNQIKRALIRRGCLCPHRGVHPRIAIDSPLGIPAWHCSRCLARLGERE